MYAYAGLQCNYCVIYCAGAMHIYFRARPQGQRPMPYGHTAALCNNPSCFLHHIIQHSLCSVAVTPVAFPPTFIMKPPPFQYSVCHYSSLLLRVLLLPVMSPPTIYYFCLCIFRDQLDNEQDFPLA